MNKRPKRVNRVPLPDFVTSATANRHLTVAQKRKYYGTDLYDRSMNDLLCKICLQVYWEPFSIICGHTFCKSCINQHFVHNNRCPICDTISDKKYRLIPNYTTAALVEHVLLSCAADYDKSKPSKKEKKDDAGVILNLLYNADDIDPDSLRKISEAVEFRKVEMEMNDEYLQNCLLYEFLEKMTEKHEKYAEQLSIQLERLKSDKRKVAEFLNKRNFRRNNASGQQPQQHQRVVPDLITTLTSSPACDTQTSSVASSSTNLPISTDATEFNENSATQQCSTSFDQIEGEIIVPSPPAKINEELVKYRERLNKHLSSLELAYFNQPYSIGNSDSNNLLLGTSAVVELEDFSQVIRGLSQYNEIRRVATLNYNVEASSPLSIVSSIEFDKDGEFFVVAGVTRMIKIYDYNLVVEFNGENPYPIKQLQCNSKISNVSWNSYNKNLLASSDYEGAVQLWDTNVGRATRTLREHERRCWTVQFNNIDPHLMASGSDDSKVKLWSVTVPKSICTIDAKANVCAVHFSPKSKNYLVFGSADHCVHLYDIRNPSKALNLFCGHRKAVSYVKYCNDSEVVSASTDGDLRIWDVNTYKCLKTLRGHQNERNFVGLSTDGNHVICGSENNHLYLYYKNISEPLMSFDFESETPPHASPVSTIKTGLSPSSIERPLHLQQTSSINDFVSAICWKKNSNIVVAANSQGITHILQLL